MSATTEAYNCGCGGPNPTSNVQFDPNVWASGGSTDPTFDPCSTVPLNEIYGQEYVVPSLPKGTFEHRDACPTSCTPRQTCPVVKCPRDFGGFILSDATNSALVNADKGVVNRLVVGTSLQFERACEPLFGGTPPAIFPVPLPTGLGINNPCNLPEVTAAEFQKELYYTVNAIIQRLQNVGIFANYTASKGHSVFRAIGHSTDSVSSIFPQSNSQVFTAVGNASKKCYGTPRIHLQDIYSYVVELTQCPTQDDTTRAQISCLNRLLANWDATFGENTDSIDQHLFIKWYEEHCYSCC